MANQITPNPSVPSQVVAEVKFPKFINNLGIIPTSYKDSMSYYECLAWLCKFLEEQVIPTVNENGEAVEELQALYVELNSYVTNYFDTLDVQEEINNKLDDMVEQGTLQEIISAYLNSTAIFGYDNVESMTNATNLINGSYAKTLGFYSKNDCGGAIYKIRNITNDDVINGYNLIEMNDEQNQLVAELIDSKKINICQIGAKGNGIDDDSEYLEFALNNYNTVIIPNKSFVIDDVVHCTNSNITLKGMSLNSKILVKNDSSISSQLFNGHGLYFDGVSNINISNLYFGDITENKSRFSYNLRFLDSNNIFISNIEINANCGPGVFFYHSEYGTVKDSYIHDTLADGVHIQRGSKYFTVENCKFYNTHDDCVGFITHGGETFGKCKELHVLNCKMLNTLTTGSGVCCDGSDDVTIENCYITQTQLSGIRSNRFKEPTESTYFYPTNINILNNTLESCGVLASAGTERASINSNQGGSMKIIGNTIKSSSSIAIYLPGVLGLFDIMNNTILSCTSGISITAQTSVAFDTNFIINIKNNIINGISNYPINITSASAVVSDSHILVDLYNNIITNVTAVSGNVLTLNSIANLRAVDNYLANYGTLTTYSLSGTNIIALQNIPRNITSDRNYIGTKRIKYAGEPPTTGTAGEIVINWNPSNGIAFWICTVASTDNSNATYKPVRTDAS